MLYVEECKDPALIQAAQVGINERKMRAWHGTSGHCFSQGKKPCRNGWGLNECYHTAYSATSTIAACRHLASLPAQKNPSA